MLHWFIILEFKLWSVAQNSFCIPSKLAKNAIFVWVSVFPTKLALTELSFWRFYLVENVVEEGDMTEEDEDDEDGVCFVTLQSWFENKETVLNW